MPRMISIAEHPYGGRDLKPGDEFDAENGNHVEILTRLKRARLADAQVESTHHREVLPVVANETQEYRQVTTPRVKRKYTRRNQA